MENPTILIVDDEPMMLAFFKSIFKKLGVDLRFLVAEDGQQALDILQNETPLVIVLDILLPRVSGFEVLKYINETPRLNRSYVALVSTNRVDRSQPHPELARANDSLNKPVAPADIQRVLQKAREKFIMPTSGGDSPAPSGAHSA